MGQFDKVTELLKSFLEYGPAGCSCAIWKGDTKVYENYVGYADLDTKKPILPDTIFRIYSMSKIITCTAALMLYERGRFLLNDPLYEYLPEFKDMQVYHCRPNGKYYTSPARNPIRIKDLFTMTSGITYGDMDSESGKEAAKALREALKDENVAQKYDVRMLCEILAKIPLAFEPGTHWHYGYSHDVLGALIEVISGKKFSQFLHDEIFEPLGMKDTFFRIPEEKRDRLCSMYRKEKDGSLKKETGMDRFYQPNAIFESGGGGLLSTLEDYGRFARMLVNGRQLDGVRILGRKTVQLMASNHLTPEQIEDITWSHMAGYGYGLGVRVMMNPQKGGINGSIGEFGWSGMAGTWVLMDPTENLTVVFMQQLLSNLEPYMIPRLRNVIYGCI